MTFSEAYAIINDISSEKYTLEGKGMAIYRLTKMETCNSVKKDTMFEIIKFLLPLAYDLPEEK